ncbi:MAG: FHA domain-containing protein [Clostridia bacterium]|nr:FHA domain-containing protein [Clostridia bacterium]
MDDENRLNQTEGYRYQKAARQSGQFITIFDGDQKPSQINLGVYGRQEVYFGRGKETETPDIVLSSRLVSRVHGRFVFSGGQWYIEDLNSTNGILCNDAYIQRRELVEGDIYRIDSRTEERQDGVMMIVSSALPEQAWYLVPLKNEMTIGRGNECDLVLHHVSVSRVHARIARTNRGWFIYDENSANGVLVNGEHIQGSVQLHEKDMIGIINTRLIFTGGGLYMSTATRGISVDARNVVIVRGRGKKSFVTSDHVSMSIKPGELISIIGGSGAGKSTILNALCGYLKPAEGSVYINGVDLYRNFDALKKIFGYVPQSDIVYDNLTLYDMLKYTSNLRLPKDMSEQERERAIDKAIEMVDLKEKRNSLIKALSGGQRKRASIAVELLPDPKLLFLDEPASGLDPGTERSLMQSLRSMANAGKTVILVTHSTLQLGLCDKVAFMGKGGRLCYFGNLRDSLRFFEVNDVVDVYQKITEEPTFWRDKYVRTLPPTAEKPRGEKLSVKKDKHRLRQLAVLGKRYAKLVLNDRQRLILLLAQAPLLALLISVVADGNQYEYYEMTKSLLFALSCSGFWIGMLNAIQEICKERTILKREYMTGLSLTSYTLSKILVLGILCLIQCAMVTGVFAAMVGLPEEGQMLSPLLEMFLTTWLSAMAATSMGLFVSSLFTNPDRAMTVAPLLLMPQMLFSGLLFSLSGATEIVSWFTVCRWSMEGYGTTADLNALPKALERTMQEMGMTVQRTTEDFFERTNEHMLRAWLILAGFTLGFLILARLILPRIRKENG